MTSQSDQFNRIASEDYDAEQIQEKIKAQRQAQSQPEMEATGKPYVAPRTPTEQWLAETVAEWLEIDRVGVDDDFFELGGDSIKALRILSRVRDKFQVEIPQSILFSIQFTVAEMAKVIDQYLLEITSDADLAAIMDELDGLSDDDAKAQLSGS